MIKMNSKVYRWCAVPECKNTSIRTPEKIFVYVPNKKAMRAKWLKLARRFPADVALKSALYFCEDHFDLPNDMENYMQYHLMGSVSQIRMRPGCIPSKFKCLQKRKVLLKKRRVKALQESEKHSEESSVAKEQLNLEENSSTSSVQQNLSEAQITDKSIQVHQTHITAGKKEDLPTFKPMESHHGTRTLTFVPYQLPSGLLCVGPPDAVKVEPEAQPLWETPASDTAHVKADPDSVPTCSSLSLAIVDVKSLAESESLCSSDPVAAVEIKIEPEEVMLCSSPLPALADVKTEPETETYYRITKSPLVSRVSGDTTELTEESTPNLKSNTDSVRIVRLAKSKPVNTNIKIVKLKRVEANGLSEDEPTEDPDQPETTEPVVQLMRLRKDIVHEPRYSTSIYRRRSCFICYGKGFRKLVHSQCVTCKEFLCFENCWREWHSRKELETPNA